MLYGIQCVDCPGLLVGSEGSYCVVDRRLMSIMLTGEL